MPATLDSPVRLDALLRERLWSAARAKPHPPLREWAETHIVLPPGGPLEGERFDSTVLPFTARLLDEIGTWRWPIVALVGPAQSFKTLCAQIVLNFKLFEMNERVICGLPDLRMANAKWMADIRPIMEAAGFDRYLPQTGSGSRGGTVTDEVQFVGHGHLRFMSGGGRAAARKGPTAPVLIATEADELDRATKGAGDKQAKLADALTLMVQRTNAFLGSPRRLILYESTATTSTGRIWRDYRAGTCSRLHSPCPHCGAWVAPDREHLKGWADAENEMQARELAHWTCPACEARISEAERRDMQLRGVILHRGQTIGKGGPDDDVTGNDAPTAGVPPANQPTVRTAGTPVIVGPLPPTRTFSFRWTAWEVVWWSAAELGALEWLARTDPDESNSERTLCQDKWGRPYDPPGTQVAELDWKTVARRAIETRARGCVPAGTDKVTAFVDVHPRKLVWTVTAFASDGSAHVVDYNLWQNVPSDEHALETAILMALREFRDLAEAGWQDETPNATAKRTPDLIVVDCGFQQSAVLSFVRESAGRRVRVWAAKGLGGEKFKPVRSAGRRIIRAGDGYMVVAWPEERCNVIEVDADHWKDWLRARIETRKGEPGAWSIFGGGATTAEVQRTHGEFSHQIVAESPVTEYSAARGREVTKWVKKINRPEHALDCCAGCGMGAHFAGVRWVAEQRTTQTAAPTTERKRFLTPDGRPFLVTER